MVLAWHNRSADISNLGVAIWFVNSITPHGLVRYDDVPSKMIWCITNNTNGMTSPCMTHIRNWYHLTYVHMSSCNIIFSIPNHFCSSVKDCNIDYFAEKKTNIPELQSFDGCICYVAAFMRRVRKFIESIVFSENQCGLSCLWLITLFQHGTKVTGMFC